MTAIEKQIQNLLVAITGMEKTQEITTKNIDKLVGSVSVLSDVDTRIKSTNKRVKDLEEEGISGIRPNTLKHILSYAALCLIGFGAWITLYIFDIDKTIATHIAESKTEQKNTDSKIKELNTNQNQNKNQITYLKGSKLDKPKG